MSKREEKRLQGGYLDLLLESARIGITYTAIYVLSRLSFTYKLPKYIFVLSRGLAGYEDGQGAGITCRHILHIVTIFCRLVYEIGVRGKY